MAWLSNVGQLGGLFVCSHRAVSTIGSWMIRNRGGYSRTERWATSKIQSDLLFEASLCGSGGGISSGRLDRLVGHDACCKLLLGPLKAGTGGTVQRMHLMKVGGEKIIRTENTSIDSTFLWGRRYLFEHDERHGGQWGKESGDDDHDDAHWDAFIQAGQRWDPPAVGEKV